MREIKFRAWDKEMEMIIYPKKYYAPQYKDGHIAEYYNPEENEFHIVYDEDDKFVLMQFTGLLDKNGKEIYEGDVVSCKVRDSEDKEYEGSYEIYWGKDFGYCFREKDYEHGLPLSWTGYESIEVIGNIYE